MHGDTSVTRDAVLQELVAQRRATLVILRRVTIGVLAVDAIAFAVWLVIRGV